MATMALLAGLSGVFDKTVPKFQVEVCTTLRGCLSATRLQRDVTQKIHFLLRPLNQKKLAFRDASILRNTIHHTLSLLASKWAFRYMQHNNDRLVFLGKPENAKNDSSFPSDSKVSNLESFPRNWKLYDLFSS